MLLYDGRYYQLVNPLLTNQPISIDKRQVEEVVLLTQFQEALEHLEQVLALNKQLQARIEELEQPLQQAQAERAADTARRRSQGAKDGWEIRRAKQRDTHPST